MIKHDLKELKFIAKIFDAYKRPFNRSESIICMMCVFNSTHNKEI